MFPSKKRQQGFLLPLAIFVLVALGGLALAISRFTAQSSLGVTQSMLDAQAFYVGESGAQYAMHRLFFKSSGGDVTRAEVDSRCTLVDGVSLNFSGPGLGGCQAALGCSRTVDSQNLTSFYALTSIAQCGSGDVRSVRTIEVSASMQ